MLKDLRALLRMRAVTEGWTISEQIEGLPKATVDRHEQSGISRGRLESFGFKMCSAFAGMAFFEWECDAESEAITLKGAIGIVHLPTRLLLARFIGSDVSGVALSDSCVEARLAKTEDVATEAAPVLNLVSLQSRHILERLANIEMLPGWLRSREVVPFVNTDADIGSMDPVHAAHAEALLILAFLAGAGQSEKTQQALREYEWLGSEDGWSPREYRRFVRQILRMLDVGSQFALPTTDPIWPACPTKTSPSRNPWRVIATQHRAGQSRREAVSAVRATSKGKTREEIRKHLGRELDRREVSMDQSMIDTTLELLATEEMRFGKVRIALRAARALCVSVRPAKKWSKARSGVQALEMPFDSSVRQWMKTPERAAYPVRSAGEGSVLVEVEPMAQSRLHNVMSASLPEVGDAGVVEVWLAWDDGSGQAGSRINVHIGDQFVARLDVDASEQLRPAMEAAAERDEDPWMTARLDSMRGSDDKPLYVLDVGLPVSRL